MLRRGVIFAIAVVLSVGLTGCRHLGPDGDHGAKTSTVVYSVTGSGVTTVAYAATATSLLTRHKDATLPFRITVHTLDHSETEYKVTATASQGTLGCAITVNGVRVIGNSAPAGRPVTCSFVK